MVHVWFTTHYLHRNVNLENGFVPYLEAYLLDQIRRGINNYVFIYQ